MDEIRTVETKVSRKKIIEGANPYDLIEDDLIPWRYDLWAEGFDVDRMDVDIIEVADQYAKDPDNDTIHIRVTAHIVPTPFKEK